MTDSVAGRDAGPVRATELAAAHGDSLAGRDLRQVVAVLSTTVITSYGVLYYAFAALSGAMVSDTGWSVVAVTGAFSLAQLIAGLAGVWVGRHIDRVGPRRVMTSGSLLALPAVTAIALAPDLTVFYVGWVLAGIAMSALLYPPAFAALTHWGGSRRLRALTTLTLVAGFASTVFAPLASWGNDWWGWRTTYLVLLVILLAITVPLHWFGLNLPWRASDGLQNSSNGLEDALPVSTREVSAIVRSRGFLLLMVAFTMCSLSVYAGIINQVPLLVQQGLSPHVASLALGLAGAGQVLGRLGFATLAARTSSTARTVLVMLAVAVTTALLALAPVSSPVLLGLAVLVGLSRGLETLIQATAVTDRWGPSAYGTLNGILSAPPLVAAAAAPFIGAALAHLLGTYEAAFLVLAAVAAIAAGLAAGATPQNGVDATQVSVDVGEPTI